MKKQLHSNLKINYTKNVKTKYNFNYILTTGKLSKYPSIKISNTL